MVLVVVFGLVLDLDPGVAHDLYPGEVFDLDPGELLELDPRKYHIKPLKKSCF